MIKRKQLKGLWGHAEYYCCSLALFVLLCPLPFLNIHRFLVFALTPFVCLVISSIKGVDFKFNISDSLWGVLIITGLSSFLWAENKALVWYPAAIWIDLFLWMIIFRQFDRKVDLSRFFKNLFVYLTISLCLGYIVWLAGSGTFVLGYKSNYLQLLLLGLWPFYIYFPTKHNIHFLLKALSFFTIGSFLFFTHSKGNVLIWIIISFTMLIDYFKHRLDYILFCRILVFLLVIVVISHIYNSNWINSIQRILLDRNDFGRLYVVNDSIRVLKGNIFIGTGFGNWFSELFTNNLDHYLGLLNNKFHRDYSHNIYLLFMVELGLVGLFCYLIIISSPFLPRLQNCGIWSPIDKAVVISFLVYFLGSAFYLTSFSSEVHFSAVQLIAFCSLSALSGRAFVVIKKSRLFLLILSILPLCWMFYSFMQDLRIKDAQMGKISSAQSNEIISSIYDPIFKTTKGFYRGGANASLDLLLAMNCLKMDSIDKAEFYFERGLRISPNDDYLLIGYAEFLLCFRDNDIVAESLLDQIYRKQSGHHHTNALLVQVAINRGDYEKARFLLKERYLSRRNDWFKLMSLQIYSSDYMYEFLELSLEQRVKLKEFKKEFLVLHDLKMELCLINGPKDLKGIKTLLLELTNRLDLFFIKELDENQLKKYLDEISHHLVGHNLWYLNYYCSLNYDQIYLIEKIMKNNFKQQKEIQLKTQLKDDVNLCFDLANRLNQLKLDLDLAIKTHLQPNQYEIYVLAKQKNRWFMKSVL